MKSPSFLKARLVRLAVEAAREGARVYAVGGCVRDWLLGRDTLDIDLAVEGDSEALARAAVRLWGGNLEAYGRFGTACVRLSDGLRVDFARARAETYERPAALPHVRPAKIEDDLRRRDFTVNAMARRVSAEGLGELQDPFGGEADLKAKRLRVLHPKSFQDDPTRLFRAARYAARFSLVLERGTERLLKEAVARDFQGLLSRERIRQELLRTLEEVSASPAMELLRGWGLLKTLHPEFLWLDSTDMEDSALVRLGLCALVMGSSGAEFIRSLKLERSVSRDVLLALKMLREKRSPLHPLPSLTRQVLETGLKGLPKDALSPLLLGGEDLKRLGLETGREFSRLLGEAAEAQWRGEFETKAGALAWVKQALKKHEGRS
jgi:tRNA nucleotidyltransferase/poly(A) polymerase